MNKNKSSNNNINQPSKSSNKFDKITNNSIKNPIPIKENIPDPSINTEHNNLDNKINNILQKDTGSMFNMFKSPSLDGFRTNQLTKSSNNTLLKSNKSHGISNDNHKSASDYHNPLNNKLTMNTGKIFNHKISDNNHISSKENHKKENSNYLNSIEKIIHKEQKEMGSPFFKNKLNFENFNQKPKVNYENKKKVFKPKEINEEKKNEENYNKIVKKFISQKPQQAETNQKKEYTAILGTTNYFQKETLDLNKNKSQNMMKSIEEFLINEKTDNDGKNPEEVINNDGPMIKKIEPREDRFFKSYNGYQSYNNYYNNIPKTTVDIPYTFPLLIINSPLSIKELAMKLNLAEKKIFHMLKKIHLENLIRQPLISIEELILIAEELKIPYKVAENFNTFISKKIENKYSKSLPGSPIIAIVGHVDHGKTSLIERLTGKQLCNSEHGNITQKISHYNIQYKDRHIRLIDTPGHSVFQSARNLAIEICDFVILIVSANEGVQPQTVDSIKFLKEFNIPFVTVITKIDINPKYQTVYRKLMENEIIPTEMNGDHDIIPISSKTGENIDTLLNYIIDISDLYGWHCDIDNEGWGYILETWQGKMGIRGSLFLKNGKIQQGDQIFVNNNQSFKIKNVYINNEKVVEATMYDAIEIEGLPDYFNSNEKFWVINNKKLWQEAEDLWKKQKSIEEANFASANPIIIEKKEKVPTVGRRKRYKTPEVIKPKEVVIDKTMKILICTRSHNDITALKQCLETLIEDNKIGPYKILNTMLGLPTDTEIDLLSDMKGCLIVFNINLPTPLMQKISSKNIPLFYNNIIYHIIQDLEEYYNNQFNSEDILEEVGQAEIVAIFKIQKKIIAGCIVRKGSIFKGSKGQLERNGQLIKTPNGFQEGIIESLKNEANDIKEAKNNQECGIYIPNITEKYQLKDKIICWRMKKVVKTQDGKIVSEKYY